MMTCNSQAANCRTTCYIPAPATTPGSRNLEPDGEPDLHGNLLIDATCLSDELRPAVPFAVETNITAALRLRELPADLSNHVIDARYAVMM